MDARTAQLVMPDSSPLGLTGTPRLDSRARSGELVRLRRAVYVDAAEWNPDDRVSTTLLRARAAQARAVRQLLFSHHTAAVLLGMPLVGGRDERLHVTSVDGASRRSRHGIVWHSAEHSDRVERQPLGELLITTARQTSLDLARSAGPLTAFILADAVAAASGDPAATRAWWAQRIEELAPGRGTRRAAAVLDLVTGLAESPLESLSLLRMCELGFEPPLQQFELQTHRGLFRLDFAWAGGAIAGEADGRAKYAGLESPALMEERLWHEKLRHDAVREKVRAYPRWNWDDAWGGVGLERALLDAGVPRPHRAARLSF